jgi:GTP cyclohydrolase I
VVAGGADAQADRPEIVRLADELGIEIKEAALLADDTVGKILEAMTAGAERGLDSMGRALTISGTIATLLNELGEDVSRDGLRETPMRVGLMWNELLAGADKDPADVLRTRDGGVGFECADYDEMVVLEGIEFVSMCEHHLMPFYGTAAVAYIPDGKVVGLSKLARLVEVYARRLQIQERMTTGIADTLEEVLQPKGVAVMIKATHMCMVARGVKKHATATTNEMRGVFRDDGRARAELLATLRG